MKLDSIINSMIAHESISSYYGQVYKKKTLKEVLEDVHKELYKADRPDYKIKLDAADILRMIEHINRLEDELVKLSHEHL